MAAPIEITFLIPAPMAALTVTVPALANVGNVRDKAREVLFENGCFERGGVVHLFMATGQVVNGVVEKEKINTNEILLVELGTVNIYVEVEPFEVNPNQAGAFYAHSQ